MPTPFRKRLSEGLRGVQPATWAFVGLFIVPVALHFWKTLHTTGISVDGGYYLDVAKHVRDSHGLVTNLSVFQKGYEFFPHPTDVYPLWPLLLGYLGRLFNLFEVARWAPAFFYATSLVAMYAAGRAFDNRPLTPYLPALNFGHVLVIVLGTHTAYGLFSSWPYTESLSFTLLGLYLWRLFRQREIKWPFAIETFVWLVLLYAVRYQMLLVALAVAAVLPLGAIARDKRFFKVHSAALWLFGFALGLRLWHVSQYSVTGSLTPLLRFDQVQASNLLPAIDVMVRTDGPWAMLADRWRGVVIAFHPARSPGYRRCFFFSQYAVVFALPFALWAGASFLKKPRGLLQTLRALETPMLARINFVIFSFGAFVLIQLVHKRLFTEWYFDRRQAIVCFAFFSLCILYLLRHRHRVAQFLGLLALCGTLVAGTQHQIAKASRVGDNPTTVPNVALAELVDWLNKKVMEEGRFVVVAPSPQRYAVHVSGVGFHWYGPDSSAADFIKLFESGQARYFITETKYRKWSMARGAWVANFERVGQVSGSTIYEWRGPK